ncbi:MAG: BCCT family transporter, partial [Desulfobacteraceae bacterium]|nr:BCCT family transporter [Desulfobacteraceae bacterium]
TMDSSSFVMATMTTKNMVAEGSMQPARWNRLFWAFALGAMGLAVILIGGMKAVQSLAVVTGLPMLFVAVLMNMSLMKWIREDYGEMLAPKTHCIDLSNKTSQNT